MIWISLCALAFLAATVTSMDFSYELPVKKIQCFGDSLGMYDIFQNNFGNYHKIDCIHRYADCCSNECREHPWKVLFQSL